MNFNDIDYRGFANRVEQKFGVHLNDYKEDQMKRRLETLAVKHGSKSFGEFALLLERDPNALAAFLDHMTINVTELFRNPDLFKALQRDILPPIVSNLGVRPFQAWSAGCSYGAEAYTLAVILSELIPSGNWRVKGTDVDLTIIAKANNPKFTAMDMVNVTPERLAKNFMTLDDKVWQPSGILKRNVAFGPHDLLGDSYLPDQYDLILCRNVVIYFTDEAKDRIFRGFYKALRPGGVLFVGGTERLADHANIGFENNRPFFYIKPGSGVKRLAA